MESDKESDNYTIIGYDPAKKQAWVLSKPIELKEGMDFMDIYDQICEYKREFILKHYPDADPNMEINELLSKYNRLNRG